MGTIDVGRDKPIHKKLRGEPVAKETPDVLSERIEELNALFPEAVAEGKIDLQKLRAALGDAVDCRPERYAFSWAGKREAVRMLQTPGRATLIPAKDESVNFEATQNVFIEGENLEVLKLLYKPYFGRVKMIYIDPPYNTGNDFIYPDNFTDPLDNYLKLTGQKDGYGNLLTSNPETSGRYHSAWLSMMYPRLFLARQLLREDGIIFISIDDHEIHNLRLIMNEIFGEENFICQLVRQTVKGGTGPAEKIRSTHDYIVSYARNISLCQLGGQFIAAEALDREDGKGLYRRGRELNKWGAAARREDRPSIWFPIPGPNGEQVYPIRNDGSEGRWRWAKERLLKAVADDDVLFEPRGDGTYIVYEKIRSTDSRRKTYASLQIDAGTNAQGSEDIKRLFNGDCPIDFPKPVSIVRRLLEITEAGSDDIVLDFFAGSCTTAQAILELNRSDGGNRRFIMVQLPEPTKNPDFPTIADIGKKRIRRVIKKMNEEAADQLDLKDREAPEDLGFKVFKLAESNWRPWVEIPNTDESPADPQDYAEQMAIYNDSLLDGWTPENVIYETAIKEGFGLGLTIDKMPAVPGQSVFKVTDPDKEQSFYICLDQSVALPALGFLALTKDDIFVCRDCALDDTTAANLALQCRLKTI